MFNRLIGTAALLVVTSGALAPLDGQSDIDWVEGPTMARLGSESTFHVPPSCSFTEAKGARRFMEVTENPPSGDEVGVLICPHEGEDGFWFVVFSYDGSGYVRDGDRDKLDAGRILASIRKGTESANEIRRQRGWETLTIRGWVREPYYDDRTHNLTWALEAYSGGSSSVNHSVRLLGRGGVMHVDLVTDPEKLQQAMPLFDDVVASHTFVPGRRYAEWVEGDKIAAYGLTALVAGGAGAAAVKTGILGRLGKLILVPIFAFFAWLKSLFARRERQPRF